MHMPLIVALTAPTPCRVAVSPVLNCRQQTPQPTSTPLLSATVLRRPHQRLLPPPRARSPVVRAHPRRPRLGV